MSLSRLPPPETHDLMLDINTTPLIDVMLVLLIMLIVTIPIQTHSVHLDLPQPASPPPVPPPVIRLTIDAQDRVAWNGTLLATRAELEQQLKAVAAEGNRAEIHLQPDPAASYAPVAMVLSEAQRLGVTRLGIMDQEPLSR